MVHQYVFVCDEVDYHENSLAGNTPYTVPPEEGGYVSYPKKVDGHVIRARSDSFKDYFSQVRIFWNSLTPIEKQHTIEAFSYQLGKVKSESVRQQNVDQLVNVDKELASIVADNIGVNRPSGTHVPVNTSYPSLSQYSTSKYAATQKVGVLIGNNFDTSEVMRTLNDLQQHGVFIVIVSEKLGEVTGNDGTTLQVDETFLTASPYLFDSLYVVGGSPENEMKFSYDMRKFIQKGYAQYKPIGIATTGTEFLHASDHNNLAGVVFATNNPNFSKDFVTAIGKQRFWKRV